MSAENQPQNKRGLLIALVAGVFALVAVGAAALLVNIAERKQEAKHAFVTPAVLNVLVEKFGLKGVTKPAADLADILGRAPAAKA